MFFPLLSSGNYSTKVSVGKGFAIISFINGSYIKYGEDEIG
jgi:hypothetical protein